MRFLLKTAGNVLGIKDHQKFDFTFNFTISLTPYETGGLFTFSLIQFFIHGPRNLTFYEFFQIFSSNFE